MWPRPRKATSHRAGSEQLAADDDAHDLVRALEDLVHAQVAHDLLDAVVVQVAVAAVQLQRLVRDAESGVGRESLRHGALHRGIRSLLVEGVRGIPHQRPRRVQLGRHVGEREDDGLLLGERLAERVALVHVAQCPVERELRAAERAGGDVDAAAVEAGHRDLEALAQDAEQSGCRHPHLVEDHLARRLGVPAHLLLVGAEREAGGIAGHEERGDSACAGSPVRAMTT